MSCDVVIQFFRASLRLGHFQDTHTHTAHTAHITSYFTGLKKKEPCVRMACVWVCVWCYLWCVCAWWVSVRVRVCASGAACGWYAGVWWVLCGIRVGVCVCGVCVCACVCVAWQASRPRAAG